MALGHPLSSTSIQLQNHVVTNFTLALDQPLTTASIGRNSFSLNMKTFHADDAILLQESPVCMYCQTEISFQVPQFMTVRTRFVRIDVNLEGRALRNT